MLKCVYNICAASGKDIRNYTSFFELILPVCGSMIIDDTKLYIRLLEEIFGYMQKYKFYRGMSQITTYYTKAVTEYSDKTVREETLMNDRKAVCASQIDGNFGRAVRFAKRAYELSKEWGLELQTNMANNLAVVYFESGDLANAERYTDEAIKIYRSLESNNHNAILALTKRPLEAITILQKLKALLEAADNSVSYDYAEITKDLAQSYLIVGNLPSARSEIILSLKTYRQVLDAFEFSTLVRRYVEIFRCVPDTWPGWFFPHQVGHALFSAFPLRASVISMSCFSMTGTYPWSFRSRYKNLRPFWVHSVCCLTSMVPSERGTSKVLLAV